MYTYIHIPMVFNPQAPTSAKADLRQRVCGAGVTRLRDQSCAAPLVPAASVKLAVNDVINDKADLRYLDLLGGAPGGCRNLPRPSPFFRQNP